MAANTDKLKKYKSLFSTTLSVGIGTGTSDTITPSTVVGLPTDTAITLTIDRVDSGGTATPSKLERITGVVSGGNLTSYVRAKDSTTEQAHTGGAVIEMVWNAQDWNDMVDWALVGHNQDGSHGASSIVASNISASAITAGTISSSAVRAGTINASAVTSGTINASAVTAGTLGASAVTTGTIGASAVTSGTIGASAVTSGTIAASAITLGTLAASSVASGNLNFTPAGGDMSYANSRFKVGTLTRDLSLASGNVAYTGVGFTPKAILFFTAMPATDWAAWGFSDGTSHVSVDREADAKFYANTPNFAFTIGSSAGNYQKAIINSFDADGFTLAWTKVNSPTGTGNVMYLAFR